MGKMKRFVAMLLCLATIMSMVPGEAFAVNIGETVAAEDFADLAHEHAPDESEMAVTIVEGTETAPVQEETAAAERSEAAEPVPETEAASPEVRPGGGFTVTASCSHSYTYTYSAAGHTQHTKKGTCSKCSATTSKKENHTWSGNRCSLCGCYKPITANGTYDVIASAGVQLYSENNSGSTKVKVVAKGTSITVTSVAAASSGYYWGKVTKVGTATQSSSAWVCMKSSELGTHSHSYKYTYEAAGHIQHTKKGTCSKCGATTSAKENHSWSGSQCANCSCYKPITANGTYDVIASAGVQLYSENNSGSTKVKVVAKGTSITVTAVAATSTGYYWGKVTKIGTATQSSSVWVCMKSSELGTHTHSYSYAYEVSGHIQHTKKGTCSKCGAATSAKENHTWSGSRCSLCGCYKPLTANGIYDVIASAGVQLYAESNSGSTKVKVVSKGTPITVTNVAATDTGYYWGKVTKIGAAAQSSSAWVCMKSSELQVHTHSAEKSYTEKSDSQHEAISACACGNKETVAESHSFSGGKCSLCGKAEVACKPGDYVTFRDSEALRVDTYADSDSPEDVPKGTYIKISEVITNKYGNYWGKVSSIDGKAPATVMYAYMGNLKSHTHALTTKYSNVNNLEHDGTEACSGCNYTKKTRSNHSFSGGKCSVCGGWEAYSKDGDYIVINTDGVKLYSERITSGTSQELDTLPKGTFVRVKEVQLNDAKNYWGKVEQIGNDTPGRAMYIYMGSGQVQPHSHSNTTTYPVHRDAWHTEQVTCKDCGYIVKSEKKDHTFAGGACKYCTHPEVPSDPGAYVPYRDSEPLREAPNQDSKAVYHVDRGYYLNIVDVEPNQYGNYWGKVTVAAHTKLETPLYVYMGNVTPHDHSLMFSYDNSNNVNHKKTETCTCGYKSTVKENHTFKDNKCSLCGALEAYKEDGTYLIINSDGVWTYSQRITSGSSSQVELLKKNSFIKVTGVQLNSADNYWGKVISVDDKPAAKEMYIYMGRGQVMPHTHSLDITYTSKSDTQHYKNQRCTVCGYATTEPIVEGHDFGSGKSCGLCGKEKVSNVGGTYVTFRTLETLRLEPYESAASAEKLPADTCVEIENVITNKYGNYWGIVKAIDGAAPKVNPTYAYMGNLVPHEHSWTKTFRNVNNLYHDMTASCSGCSMGVTERLDHRFSNGVCEDCTAWQANETNGDYITVKDDVPVYSRNITSPEDSRVLESLPKNTFVQVVDVQLNSANNYWGRVVRIGNREITGKMYIYMGRGQVQPHGHTMATAHTKKSDTQHYVNNTCSVCGYANTKPTVEDHAFDSAGVCKQCKTAEVVHIDGDYVTVREHEALRADRYSDAEEVENCTKGTALKVTDIQTNKYGNWWGRVVEINGKAVNHTCYTYLGNLKHHVHAFKETVVNLNNVTHKIVKACSGCSMKTETREDHRFQGNVCTVCNAWEPHVGNGGYVTIKEEGVPLYSKKSSDESKGSKLLKTLPAGTYIEVEDVRTNDADNYWGKVTKIGNYSEKQTMYVYMGRGQLQIHRERNHTYDGSYESVNNLKHRAVKVCTVCSYTVTVEEDHRFGTGEHNACTDCGAWKPNTKDGMYITVKDDVILYSKRSSDAKSKNLKTLPKGTFLGIINVETNSAGNWWGKVTVIDNDPTGKTAMYVYMGSGQLQPHTHEPEYVLISTSDTQHVYGYRCLGCKCFAENNTQDHVFQDNRCTFCGREAICHETGTYVTVRPSESLRADTYSDSKEVRNVPAGTLIEVSKVVVNKYGNYWGKVSKISGKSVGKQTVYTYLGNLERHENHDLKPHWVSESDIRHKIGEKCTKCEYAYYTSVEDHAFGSGGICAKCGKEKVSNESGSYVTFRESEPLRAGASKDAKALKNVPSGTRLQIVDILENDYSNRWGIVSQIDGTATDPKKPMYVYMGNVKRHESHDMQPFCDRKSDTQHISGIGCTGCNLTMDTEKKEHRMDSGRCLDCGAEEIFHENGGYLVRIAGNLKKGSGQDTGNVQWVAEGEYLDVTDITENEFGNWWGKVTAINGKKPKQSNAYVYLGNLTPHAHDLFETYVPKNLDMHTVTVGCKICDYLQTVDTRHAEAVDGKCPICQAAIPRSTAKGDYATFREVTLYQDNKLTKPAGITVEAGYLVKITSVKSGKDGNGNAVYVGKLSQYGKAPTGKASLYVNMADIIPHVDHAYDHEYWSRCDEYHYRSRACSLLGCNATKKGKEELHQFVGGKCECGKTPVLQDDGIYRVHSGSDVVLYSKPISSSSQVDTAKAGTIIAVEGVALTPDTGNYWGKVIWFNGRKPSKETYVYMGSLVRYTRSASVTVAGADQSSHYFRDGKEIFPEKHSFVNGTCSGCGMVKNAPATGLYIVKEQCRVYYKDNKYEVGMTVRKFQTGNILQITEIGYYSGAWYGLVATCDGAKVKADSYVQLALLTYHDKHVAGSEHWTRLDDKQHTYDINCPVCGINKKVKADHAFDDQGVCIFCQEAQPFKEKGDYYIAVKPVPVYKTASETGAILETLPKGTILKVSTVSEKKGIYMGTGIQVQEDGKLTAHKGHIRMSRTYLAAHQHSALDWKLAGHTETRHTMVSTCTDCGYVDEWHVPHGKRACKVCGAMGVTIGHYTVKAQSAKVYRDTSGKKAYATLKEGEYVYISEIIDQKADIYWGKVFRIGELEIQDDVYIPMNMLMSHVHDMEYVLTGSEDNQHIYKAACKTCSLIEQRKEDHTFELGKCTVCENTVVPSSIGVYVAAKDFTVYKKAGSTSKVAKKPEVKKGTHVFIREVKLEGEILWGCVEAAGSTKYSGKGWIRMNNLKEDCLRATDSFTREDEQNHWATFGCTDCSCGLNGSIKLKHAFAGTGACTFCGFDSVENGTYYTARDNCKVYEMSSRITDGDYKKIYRNAGTAVKVIGARRIDGKMYCQISGTRPAQWIAWKDLVDHRHAAAGLYGVVDDEYHQLGTETGTVCMICGVSIPGGNMNFTRSKHTYEGGFCKLCNMPEIPDTPGSYYAPYDGFYAFKSTSQFSGPVKNKIVYKAGAKIEIVEAPISMEGIIWGKVKTGGYVRMKDLSTTPVKQSGEAKTLTDQEIIEWCVNFNGATPFSTYGYYTEMLSTIDAADILLMSVNSRAAGLGDQLVKWIKEACGDTMARQYYEGQIMSMLKSLEQDADYSASIPYKSELKKVIKLSRTVADWRLTYKGSLKESDLEAIQKLGKYLKTAGNLLDKGEHGLELYSYMVMDFGRMQGVIETAKAIQREATDDPDLHRAFDDVIKAYEEQYYLRTDHLTNLMVKLLEDQIDLVEKEATKVAVDVIKELTGFDVTQGWSDFGFVYSTVNYMLDLGLKHSGAADYSDAMLEFMSQISIMSASQDAHHSAVDRIKSGDHSAAAVEGVRRQFAAYKASMVELYDTMLTMATGHIWGIGEDVVLITYLQYEKDKLESVYLVNDYALFVNGISYKEFKRTY